MIIGTAWPGREWCSRRRRRASASDTRPRQARRHPESAPPSRSGQPRWSSTQLRRCWSRFLRRPQRTSSRTRARDGVRCTALVDADRCRPASSATEWTRRCDDLPRVFDGHTERRRGTRDTEERQARVGRCLDVSCIVDRDAQARPRTGNAREIVGRIDLDGIGAARATRAASASDVPLQPGYLSARRHWRLTTRSDARRRRTAAARGESWAAAAGAPDSRGP
jgi:hypothetical protein